MNLQSSFTDDCTLPDKVQPYPRPELFAQRIRPLPRIIADGGSSSESEWVSTILFKHDCARCVESCLSYTENYDLTWIIDAPRFTSPQWKLFLDARHLEHL
jgi:hypothetical protein